MLDDFVDEAALDALAESLVAGHRKMMRDLVAMREKHNLKQWQVAERMGVSQPTVAAFERYDSNPTLSTIRRYALAVDARIDQEVRDQCADSERVSRTFEALVGPQQVYVPSKPKTISWHLPPRVHA